MGRAITRWVAEDGIEFESERDMILHELDLIDVREIEVFLEGRTELSARRKTEYGKILRAWQQYKNRQADEALRARSDSSRELEPMFRTHDDGSDPGAPVTIGDTIGRTTSPHITEEDEIAASFNNAQHI